MRALRELGADYDHYAEPIDPYDCAPRWCRKCKRLDFQSSRIYGREYFCIDPITTEHHDIDIDEKITDCPRVKELTGDWKCVGCQQLKLEYEDDKFFPICDVQCPYFPGGGYEG